MSTTTSNIQPSLYERVFLRPLGLNSDNSLVLWLLLLAGVIITGSLWYFEGDIVVTLSILYVVTIAVLSFLHPGHSLSMLIFLVLIFDQYGIPEFDPLTYQIDFFRNLKEISYIPFFDGGMTNVIEIHLLFIVLSLFISVGIKKDFQFRGIPVWGACAVFFACFLFSFLYGLKDGGDLLIATWEVRALFYLVLMFLITPQLIRTKSQLRGLIWIFIIAITFKAFQAILRFIELGFTTGGLATLSNHEDPVFMVTLFILMVAFIIFKSNNKQLFWLLVLVLPLLLGFYFGMRRAAYASMMVSFCVFMVLLHKENRRKFLKVAIPALIFILIYGAAFWNHNGRLGRPVQMVKTGLERPTIEENYEDYHSNLYRENEAYNLAKTIENHPLIGIGFGNAYDQPVELFAIRFPLMDYIPHNEILWVMVKMGVVGFFAFWFFFNCFVARGVSVYYKLTDPYLKAVAVFIIVAVINQMVVSYFDLQLTYYRNMIYLGCLMGLLKTVEEINKEENSDSKQNKIKAEKQGS